MAQTSIEWTDRVWNPTTGCTKVSAGCLHCYAETMDRRLVARNEGGRFVPWTVKAQREDLAASLPVQNVVRLHPERLEQPLRWKKPSRVFVDSMSDLFHEDVPDEFIDRIFATMALTPEHTYQILTKRPERAVRWFARPCGYSALLDAAFELRQHDSRFFQIGISNPARWPLSNVWIGVSVTGSKETVQFLDTLRCIPAAVRFVSYEPALKPFDFTPWMPCHHGDPLHCFSYSHIDRGYPCVECSLNRSGVDWLIIGAESGPKARRFDYKSLAVVEQCQDLGVPVFVKQLPHPDGKRGHVSTDPHDWPEAYRVREFPA